MKLIAILVYLSLQILLVFSRVENTKLKGEDYTKVLKQIQGITQKWPFPSKCKKGTVNSPFLAQKFKLKIVHLDFRAQMAQIDNFLR